MENKKIRGATSVTRDNITFKSKLEERLFGVLEKENMNPMYEPYKYVVWTGYRPNVPFYIKSKKTKQMQLEKTKILDITYTPDIVFFYGKYIVFVEVKPDGFCNDVYPYKRKLFRKFLETNTFEYNNTVYYPIFCQVGTQKYLKDFITILKNKYNEGL